MNGLSQKHGWMIGPLARLEVPVPRFPVPGCRVPGSVPNRRTGTSEPRTWNLGTQNVEPGTRNRNPEPLLLESSLQEDPMRRPFSLLLAFVVSVVAGGAVEAQGQGGGGAGGAAQRARPLPSITERTEGFQKLDGFYPLYFDDATG